MQNWYTTLFQLCINTVSTLHQSWYKVDTRTLLIQSWHHKFVYKVVCEVRHKVVASNLIAQSLQKSCIQFWYTNSESPTLYQLCIDIVRVSTSHQSLIHSRYKKVDSEGWCKVDVKLIHKFAIKVDTQLFSQLCINTLSTLYQSWYKVDTQLSGYKVDTELISQLCINSASTSHQSWYTANTRSCYKLDTQLCINSASTSHQSWYTVNIKS